MPIDLHPDCKARIKQELAKHLHTVTVKNRYFLDRPSTEAFFRASQPIPGHGPVAKELERYIGEWPLYDFLYGVISQELREKDEYASDAPSIPITELGQYADATAVADRLIDQFATLPWRYTFSIPLMSFLSPVLD